MQIYFKDGFYIKDGYTQIPESAVEISQETYRTLLQAQANGKQIHTDDNGQPVALDPRPSEFHELNDRQWTLSAEQSEKLIQARKTALIERLADKADSLTQALLAGYPQTEIESFYRQEKEALAHKADPQAPTPMLTQIAQNRGIALELLVAKILEKANQFAHATGVIIGQRQKFETRILSAENLDDLTALSEEITQWQFNLSA